MKEIIVGVQVVFDTGVASVGSDAFVFVFTNGPSLPLASAATARSS